MKYLNFKTKIIIGTLLVIGAVGVGYSANAEALNTLDFAGRTWTVKSGSGGPGPNNWGSSAQDVFVDGSGLHLKVSQHEDDLQWYSSEVYLPSSLGYGKYTFDIDSSVDQFDHNLVAAPFLYQDDSHEIDIEHSYWSDETGGNNLFYTVQPFNTDGNQQQSVSTLSAGPFQDIINWQPDQINFSTKQNGNEISSFTYTSSTDGNSNNFTPGSELVHINFWQYQGATPAVTSSEFIVSNFSFDPYVAPTPSPTSSATTSSHLVIRYNDAIILDKDIALTTTTYHDAINNIDYPLDSTSTVFSLLVNADQQNDNLEISDDQFASWANSFYLKCINLTINTSTQNACDNWQYTVDGTYPSVGMDKKELTGGENVYIYFGDRYQLTTDKTSFTVGETATATLKEYSYTNNDWTLSNGQLVLATEPILPDYSNYPPATISSATTTDGLALFNFNATGTYFITLPDSYWPGVTVSITSTTTTTDTSTSTGGGGGSTPPTNELVSDNTINTAVNKLINFIKTNQSSDGKIIDGGTSDWLTMTLAAKNIYAADVKNSSTSLYDFVYNYDNSLLDSELNNCTAYPRHILALLASGVSKDEAKITALKTKLDGCVQSGNFGQAGINDDVFGLIAAIAIGEGQNSTTTQTTLNAIKSNQEADGGFAYPGPFESPDLTGAAMNALKYAQNNGATVDATIFTKAKQYLKAQQLADGGWGYFSSDALTTSWAVMGINALGEGQNDWFNSAGKNPWNVLTTLSDDHYIQSWDSATDWFGTKSAVPALTGKSWPLILDPKTGSAGSGTIVTVPTSTVTTTIATTTFATTTVATTTIATSTPSTTVELKDKETEIKPVLLVTKPAIRKVSQNSAPKFAATNSSGQTASTKPATQTEELTSAEKVTDPTSPIDNLPLDTPTRRTAKKVLAVTGGSAAALGLYLGLRLLKNVL